MTTIHNKYKESYDVYIGRPTIFGNPFVIGKHGTRDEVIEKYRVYFEKRVRNDNEFLLAVMALKNKRLGCFCKPMNCHGNVICDFLNKLDLG